MQSTRIPSAVAVFGLVALSLPALGCNGPTDGAPADEAEHFAATLNVDQIVGGNVVSDGTGVASLTFDGNVLSYTIDVQNMTGVTMAHIHGAATPATNAAIRVWLFGPPAPTGAVNGRLVSGTISASSPGFEGGTTLDDVIRLMRNDSAYVLVHTSVHPDGEIRGHITR